VLSFLYDYRRSMRIRRGQLRLVHVEESSHVRPRN